MDTCPRQQGQAVISTATEACANGTGAAVQLVCSATAVSVVILVRHFHTVGK